MRSSGRALRVAAIVLLGSLCLLALLLFWPYFLDWIIRPVAQVAWIFLRLFVLSIDQWVFWTALVVAAAFLLFRLLLVEEPLPPVDSSLEPNEMINNISYWRGRFSLREGTPEDKKMLRRTLAQLLASYYASKSRTQTIYEASEALRCGEIPLPEHLHAYLFPPDAPPSGSRIRRLLHSAREALRAWVRRRTGREKAEHYRMIEEVLHFLETSMETKNE